MSEALDTNRVVRVQTDVRVLLPATRRFACLRSERFGTNRVVSGFTDTSLGAGESDRLRPSNCAFVTLGF